MIKSRRADCLWARVQKREKQLNLKLGVAILGQVTLTFGGHTSSVFSTSKVRDLLVLLVLRRGAAVNRGALIDQLWPDSDDSNERNRLSVAVYHLRRAIDATGASGKDVIGSNRGSIWIERNAVICDLWDFESELGKLPGPGRLENPSVYRRVFDLYRGPIDLYSDAEWLKPWRGALATTFAEAVDWLWRDSVSRGDHPEALAYLREALIRDPGLISIKEGLAEYYAEVGRGELAVEAMRAVVQHYREQKLVPTGRVNNLIRTIRDQFMAGSRKLRRAEEETLTAVLVDDESRSHLFGSEGAGGFGLTDGQGPLLLKNPLAAVELAHELLVARSQGRVSINTVVMDVHDAFSDDLVLDFEDVPEGEIWLNRAAAALVESHSNYVVREVVNSKAAYKVLRE